jgi:hypothetical protein
VIIALLFITTKNMKIPRFKYKGFKTLKYARHGGVIIATWEIGIRG